MIIIDGVQQVSTVCAGGDGAESAVYKLAEAPGGALYPGFPEVFESTPSSAIPAIPAD